MRIYIPHPPNVELVTLATFFAALYLGKKFAIIVPLFILILSDVILGNTSIFLFTWSAYFVIGLASSVVQRFVGSIASKIISSTIGGVLATCWFYVWTNFGVWLLDSWGMYPHDFSGLIKCYINGLPFLRNQLVGNLIFLPVGIFLVEETLILLKSKQFKSLKENIYASL